MMNFHHDDLRVSTMYIQPLKKKGNKKKIFINVVIIGDACISS